MSTAWCSGRPPRCSSSSASSNRAVSDAPGVQIGNACSRPGRVLAGGHRLAGAHPVLVALHRVDLAVVGDVPVRVSERPRREGVGREPGVDEQQRALDPVVGQVAEELTQLRRREHPLVDDRSRRQRREVHLLRAGLVLVLDPLASDIGAPIEIDARLTVGRRDEQLPEARHRRPCGLAEAVGVDRHVAPTEDGQAFLGEDLVDASHHLVAHVVSGRAGRRCRPRSRPAVGSSKSTVSRSSRSGIWIRMPAPSPVSGSAPVAPRCSRLVSASRPVRTSSFERVALHVRDERNATGVVFETRVVEARGPRGRQHRYSTEVGGWLAGVRDDVGPKEPRSYDIEGTKRNTIGVSAPFGRTLIRCSVGRASPRCRRS